MEAAAWLCVIVGGVVGRRGPEQACGQCWEVQDTRRGGHAMTTKPVTSICDGLLAAQAAARGSHGAMYAEDGEDAKH